MFASKEDSTMQTDAFHVFDTTLRDGAQREGITYSVADKLAVARLLDEVGVGFIEGGWPGSNPKDTEFFARAAAGELKLQHAVMVAFGATRKAGVRVEDDAQVRALLDAPSEGTTDPRLRRVPEAAAMDLSLLGFEVTPDRDNSDYVYLTTEIDPAGVYRISGSAPNLPIKKTLLTTDILLPETTNA